MLLVPASLRGPSWFDGLQPRVSGTPDDTGSGASPGLAEETEKVAARTEADENPVCAGPQGMGDHQRRIYTGNICRLSEIIGEVSIVERSAVAMARASRDPDQDRVPFKRAVRTSEIEKRNQETFDEHLSLLLHRRLTGRSEVVASALRSIPDHLLRNLSALAVFERRSLYRELHRTAQDLKRTRLLFRELIESSIEAASLPDDEVLEGFDTCAPQFKFALDLARRATSKPCEAMEAHSAPDAGVAFQLLRAD